MSARMDCGEGWRGCGAGAGVACTCEINRQSRLDRAVGRCMVTRIPTDICLSAAVAGW